MLGTRGHAAFVHGKDGLGDVPDEEPLDEKKYFQETHAVIALIEQSKKYKGGKQGKKEHVKISSTLYKPSSLSIVHSSLVNANNK